MQSSTVLHDSTLEHCTNHAIVQEFTNHDSSAVARLDIVEDIREAEETQQSDASTLQSR